jgi:hypothetical protein
MSLFFQIKIRKMKLFIIKLSLSVIVLTALTSISFPQVNMAPWLTTENIYCIQFVDDDLVWMAGSNGALFRSTNGGEEWDKFNTGFDMLRPFDLLVTIQILLF